MDSKGKGLKIVLKDERLSDFLQNRAYLDINRETGEIDFCLGKTVKEAGEICRRMLEESKTL